MKKFIISILIIMITVTSAITITFGVKLFHNKQNKYEIFVDLNDERDIIIKTVDKGSTIGEIEIPVREGYNFLYWTFNGEKCSNDDKLVDNMKIVANWALDDKDSLKSYIISFDPNNGDNIFSQTVEEGNTLLKPKNPQKDKYTFQYWELEGKEYDFSKPVISSFELKAKWKKKNIENNSSNNTTNNTQTKTYTVTFNSQGGTVISSQIIIYGNQVQIPGDPQREGYIFECWLYNGEEYDFSKPVNKNIELVAKWIKLPKYSINIEKTSLSIEKGKDLKIKIEFTDFSPDDWLKTRTRMEDKNIARITSNVYDMTSYTIHAEKVGKTKLLLIHPYDATVTKEIEIIVYENKVTGIDIKCDNMEIALGSYRYPNLNIYPSNATNQKVYWSSSNQNVATVDEFGRIHGIGEGTSTVTVRSDDGSFSDSCNIIVKYKKVSQVIFTNAISLHNVNVGDTYQYKIQIYPDDATNKKVYWSSSHPEIVSIDQNGFATALRPGYVIISVKVEDSNCENLKTDECIARNSLNVLDK